MSVIILDGKEIANNVLSSVKKEGKSLAKILGRPLKMCIVSVGERQDSKTYIKSKLKKASSIGFEAENIVLPSNVSQYDLENTIENLSNNHLVDGIILQLPITEHLDPQSAIDKIAYFKDIDGLTSHNQIKYDISPCTPIGIIKLIEFASSESKSEISGKHAVVVGRSTLVGKPTAELLLRKNCTVTICHSKTANLDNHLLKADILVAAIGKAKLIKTVKKGAIVIDVGINHIDNTIVGDVDFDLIYHDCLAISPVPGGVGPMTVAMLMENLVNAVKLSLKR